MSEKVGYSPSFKRPAEILRMRRKRARSEAGVFSSPSGQSPGDRQGQSGSSPACVRPFSPGPLFVGGTKRRNPFANIENIYSPRKKLLVYHDVENDEEDKSGMKDCQTLSFAERLAEAEELTSGPKCPPTSKDDSLIEEKEENVKSPLLKSPQSMAPLSIAPPVCTEYPPDWSLKTRLLFTSSLPLSWAEQPKAQEEAAGLSQHCKAQFHILPHSLQDPRSCSELRCAFLQSLIYWQHPSLPWISLFPRINAERSFAGKSLPWAQDASLQQSLMREWSISLSSLYSLLKARLCPYFYLCSYQFTVLFRAAGLGGSSGITALISPTTRGLREAMKAEGIEYSLPLVEEKRKSKGQQNLPMSPGDEEESKDGYSDPTPDEDGRTGDGGDADEDEDEDGGFSWLKEMGVDDKIKKPDSISLQIRKEGHTMSLDHKAESVVCVEGSHTFTLINFLINCKSLVAVAGSQAGLPPTLLAPTAFRGATMHTLKARSVNVRTQVGSTFQNISSLEVAGPVMPSSLHAITTLLRPAQKGSFSAGLFTHAPTAIMNIPIGPPQASHGPADLSGCGLHPASIQQLQQPPSLGKTGLSQLAMNNYSYTWKS